ncbi:MAG TPA: apolipoprotein N-acyltransferase, partial [Bdellovibrionales bacterium]|nr:apolipoprotein N-acyltransferase [Bdellovibrionales bacterium]
WYGKWQQPMQHLYMTLARAIEVRRPLVRSTNTGITTVVLANGDILPLGPLHQEWFSLYEVPYSLEPATTPFMGWAYYAMPALLGLAVVAIPVVGRRKD